MESDLAWLTDQVPGLTIVESLPPSGQRWSFRCRHVEHGESVLKLVKPGKSNYLDREVEAVQRLSSSNVPRVYELGSVTSQMGPLVWLLEQYVDGIDLSDKLASDGPRPKEELLTLALDLLSAAADAEKVQVVHRDIKPDNIKIDADGKAWLLDFGIARILDLESRTRTDAISGPHSPGYGAPEQFRYSKREIDGRSDLFAVGVVLYESATGINPFIQGARDRLEILHRVEHDHIPRLSLDWDNARLFADLVLSLTQKAPHQRPDSCAMALDWIRDIVTQVRGN